MIKFMKLLVSVFLLLASANSFAQSIIISGRAEAYKGNEITLCYYQDYLTFHEVQLASTLIDAEGVFKIKAEIPSTIKAFLRIENIGAHIFLEPYKNYFVYLNKYDSATSRFEGNISWIPLQITDQDSTSLNYLIQDFNKRYDDFLDQNYPLLMTKKAGPQINSFKKSVKISSEKTNNQYFINFVNYSIATLDQISFPGKQMLFEKYIRDKPVLYQNPEYMAFFREFFASHMLMYSQSSKGVNVIDLVAKKKYPELLSNLKKDTLLKNERLRELVLMKGLYENYYTKLFNQKAIDTIFSQIATGSPYPEHRQIANNILLKTSKLAPGKPAPDFKLLDVRGKETSLSDFKGKYVYLNFWATWCVPCLQEMRVMESLHQKYGDKVVFLSVSIDKNQAMMDDYLAKHKEYGWVFLHYGHNKKIKEIYDISNIPAYFLIDPDGKFLQSPADSPINYIELTIAKLLQAPDKKIRVGDK